jgi:hypothetical protein
LRNKLSNEKKDLNFIKRFFAAVLIEILLIGMIVFLLDPFYHYHKPWFGLKAVLNDKEYQCVGTLKNFDYDALIQGDVTAITKYFETVHSNIWIYTVTMEQEATLYYMNKEEFNEFLHTFCFFNERFNVRCRATSGKMIAWFENKLN